jgi:hypothetical protein
MTKKELLALIARQFDYLELDEATSHEAVICESLVEHGYLRIEDMRGKGNRSYSAYRISNEKH